MTTFYMLSVKNSQETSGFSKRNFYRTYTSSGPSIPFIRSPHYPSCVDVQSLLSFKAGKMDLSDKGGDKFHITPDLRKGTVSLFKGPDDQLMHFSWKERPSGRVVDVSISF